MICAPSRAIAITVKGRIDKSVPIDRHRYDPNSVRYRSIASPALTPQNYYGIPRFTIASCIALSWFIIVRDNHAYLCRWWLSDLDLGRSNGLNETII
jgi:hypothetical protein